MIAKIKGKIEQLKDNYVIIDVGGLGYKVFLTSYATGKIAGQENAELFTYTHVREDVLALYGFLTQEELEMFELLISISGIGPKAALGILTIASVDAIRMAVLNEDTSILTKVSGVGKKTAERVILELKSKVAKLPAGSGAGAEKVSSDSELLEALVGMGYSSFEAREAVKNLPKDLKDISAKLKWALRAMRNT